MIQIHQLDGTDIFDTKPAAPRIGLVVLSSDLITEGEFTRVVPHGEISIHATRVTMTNPVTPENLRLMAPQLSQAAGLLPENCGSIAYCCTSGTVAIGDDQITDKIGLSRPGVPVVTPIGSGVEALRLLGCKRVSVLTPYNRSTNKMLAAFIEAQGFAVDKVTGFNLESDLDMVRVAPEAIRHAARDACDLRSDGLFISCTALRALEVVDTIERDLSKPVVTAIQAMIWGAVRKAGYAAKLAGFGRLLREH